MLLSSIRRQAGVGDLRSCVGTSAKLETRHDENFPRSLLITREKSTISLIYLA